MAPSTQKALVIPAEKQPATVVSDWPVPKLGPKDVLVKIVTAALNPVDAFVEAMGGGPLVPGYPFVNGVDGAGTVEELGSDVQGFAKGDKVYVPPNFTA